jgi:class 3 adenylate cyclase/tetratricopeptide (TPR) repeat protein
MQCPRCGVQHSDDAAFCDQCGARVEVPCPRCGESNRPGANFCRKCGERLPSHDRLGGSGSPGGRESVAASPFGSPEDYTPAHLATKILTSKSSLEGERKQVTVLFADLKGSMELLADRDPEEARNLLDPVLERMMEAVHRYEGTVNQVMGDGIMALFGAPLACEDHAIRACHAALWMQESVRRYAEEAALTARVPVSIRVGLNSGDVVVRAIGSDLHMDYTAVGQTAHLAARMEQAASPGSILITAQTFQLAEGYVEVRPLGPMPVKGLVEAVEAYEVTGAGPARSRLQVAAARGLTRFVGREAELDQLRGALGRASAGRGQIVAVVGEPGVGKSRLLYEFTHSPRPPGWLIVESGSVSHGTAMAYLPVIELLRAYFDIENRDQHREIREKVTGKLLALDRALEPALAPLLAILEIPVEDPQWLALDPPQRRHRTLEAVRSLLIRESQVQPLLVILEDLQWIDSESQALLDGLVESLPTARVLLLVNYRPEYRHGWGSKTYYVQIRLDPLPPQTAEQLLQALLGDDPGTQALTSSLIERTEGNPFFLEECVRALVETDVVVGTRGAYRLSRPLENIQVPASVHAVLAARIDRLPPEKKRLLQSASVIGKDVPFVLLQAIAETAEETLRGTLTHLQAAEFLYETRRVPDLEYTFKHALTHEVAYASLLTERRRALHARIVAAIEDRYPDRLTEHVERLGHHAFKAGLWEKAVGFLRQAGNRAATRGAWPEAVVWLEQALVALGHLPESRQVIEQAVDVRFELQAPLTSLAAVERMLEYLREAHALAGRLDDQRRLGRVAAHMTHCYWFTGKLDQAVVSGLRALAIASALGDIALEVLANSRLAQAYSTSGEYSLAIERAMRNVELLEGELISERFGLPVLPAVTSRTGMAFCFSVRGDFVEAADAAEDARRVAELVDHAFSRDRAYSSIGHTQLSRGNIEGAIHWLERGLEFYRSEMYPYARPWVTSALGIAYTFAGRTTEGTGLIQEAAEESASTTSVHPRILAWLGEAYLMAGRAVEALHAAERALDLTRIHGQRGVEAEALRIIGDIHASHNWLGFEKLPHSRSDIEKTPHDLADFDKAEISYREAMALAATLGMRPLIARCRLGLGKLYRGKSRRVEAEQQLMTAAAMFREMDMPFWLRQAETELNKSSDREARGGHGAFGPAPAE